MVDPESNTPAGGMQVHEQDMPTLKIVVIGSSGVGKSSLTTRYISDHFDEERTGVTIAVDVFTKKLMVRGTAYRVHLFDTAGQERHSSIPKSYYRGVHGALVVYDVCNRASFEALGRWVAEARAHAPEAALFLVGSKLDLADEGARAVSADEGRARAQAYGAVGFCEVSTARRERVREPFVGLVRHIVEHPEIQKGVVSRLEERAVQLNNERLHTTKCCWYGGM